MRLNTRTICFIIITFTAISCSPQGSNESDSKELLKKGLYTDANPEALGEEEKNMTPGNQVGNLPRDVKLALDRLSDALRPIEGEPMALVASSGGIIDRLPIEQRKFFYGLNQEIFDCTIGQFKAIDLRDRFKACELANACKVKLGNVERNYFDIHAELSDSYRVLQDAAEVNSRYCTPFRRGPVGFP